jgi:flagellin-like protein
MNKLLKSRKALSPVIASIILVAVTVAVSIAVAAWMGALTFSFTKNDQFNIASVNFVGTSSSATSNQINMTMQNTGSSSWTLQPTAQVNAITGLPVKSYGNGGGGLNCTNGKLINIYITTTSAPWVSGNQYTITMYMTDGTKVTYVATAP